MAESYAPLGVCGNPDDPFAGRLWLRRFADGQIEVMYRAGDAPRETEKLRSWLQTAGQDIGAITFPKRPGWSGHVDAETGEVLPEDNTARMMRRAKQQLRWSLKAIGADHLLTLTYRANQTDYATARQHLTKFLRLCREEWPNWKHAGAPERQVRGAWHWHIGVKGWQNYDKLRGFWWRAQGYRVRFDAEGKPHLPDGTETPGNVQGVSGNVRGRRARVWSSDRMASYLSKYLSKCFGDESIAGKTYSVSRGLKWSCEPYAVRALTFEGVATSVLGVCAAAGVPLPYVWTAPTRTVLWASGSSGSPPE